MQMLVYREVVRTLQPTIEPIFAAIEKGLAAAVEEHSNLELRRTDDPWFYAHLARRIACDALVAVGLQALNEDSGRPVNAMSGLLVLYQGVAMKILRATFSPSGQRLPPIPGRSEKGKRFWRQEPTLDLDDMRVDNILLTWHDQNGVLAEPMKMYRPTAGDHRRDSFRCSWEGKFSRGMANMRVEDLELLSADFEYSELGSGQPG